MEEIYNLLLSTIGLSFENGRLYDDDKMVLLLYKQKYIVENESDIMRKNAIVFDPLNNKMLAQYLFNVYIEKEQAEQELYLLSFQIVPEKIIKVSKAEKPPMVRRKLLMIVGDGHQIETRYYYNEALAYIEAIFMASGAPIYPELYEYDMTEEGDTKK